MPLPLSPSCSGGWPFSGEWRSRDAPRSAAGPGAFPQNSPHCGRCACEVRSQNLRPSFTFCQPRTLGAGCAWAWLLAGPGQQNSPRQGRVTWGQQQPQLFLGEMPVSRDSFIRPKPTHPLRGLASRLRERRGHCPPRNSSFPQGRQHFRSRGDTSAKRALGVWWGKGD